MGEQSLLSHKEKSFLAHHPFLKYFAVNAEGAVHIEDFIDDQKTYTIISPNEISFKKSSLKEVFLHAKNVRIDEAVTWQKVHVYLLDASGYFQIMPKGSLETTFIEMPQGLFFNWGRLTSQTHQTLKLEESCFFNQGEMEALEDTCLSQCSLFENTGVLKGKGIKVRARVFSNQTRLEGNRVDILASQTFYNRGEIVGRDVTGVSLGDFLNNGLIQACSTHYLMARHLFFQGQKSKIEGRSLEMHSFGSFVTEGEIRGHEVSFTARDFKLGALARICAAHVTTDAQTASILGHINAKMLFTHINERLKVGHSATLQIGHWFLMGKGDFIYQGSSFNSFKRCSMKNFSGRVKNDGVWQIQETLEGMCPTLNNDGILEVDAFNLTVGYLKNNKTLKGRGFLWVENGENQGIVGGVSGLALSIEGEFKNTGMLYVQNLFGQGCFKNQGMFSGCGTAEKPIMISLQTFENGEESGRQGRILSDVLKIRAGVTFKFSERSLMVCISFFLLSKIYKKSIGIIKCFFYLL